MVYTYRKTISGSEIIAPDVQYSFIYQVSTPKLSKNTLKLAFDLVLERMASAYPLKTVSYVLWEQPAYPNIEIIFIWRERPGEDLGWFSGEIEELASEYSLYLDLQGVAAFLPKEEEIPPPVPLPLSPEDKRELPPKLPWVAMVILAIAAVVIATHKGKQYG